MDDFTRLTEHGAYFIWQGRNSRKFMMRLRTYGLAITELPSFKTASARADEIYIDGRNEAIIRKNGYSCYDVTFNFAIPKYGEFNDTSNLREAIYEFFYGEAYPSFENTLQICGDDRYFYKAELLNGINLEQFFTKRKGSVTFRVQPFKYPINARWATNAKAPYYLYDGETLQLSYDDGAYVPKYSDLQYSVVNTLPRHPRLIVELPDLTAEDLGIITVEAKSNGNSQYRGRAITVAYNRLRNFNDNAKVLVFDFKNNDYYACLRAPAINWQGSTSSAINPARLPYYDKTNMLTRLEPFAFNAFNSYDIIYDAVSGAEAQTPSSLWHDIIFNGSRDTITVKLMDSSGNPMTNARYTFAYCNDEHIF